MHVINHSHIKRRLGFIYNNHNCDLKLCEQKIPFLCKQVSPILYMKLENKKSLHISKTPKIISILINKIYIESLARDIKRARKRFPLFLPVPSQPPPPHPIATLPSMGTSVLQSPEPAWSGLGEEARPRTASPFCPAFPSEPRLESSWATLREHLILLHILEEMVLALTKKRCYYTEEILHLVNYD